MARSRTTTQRSPALIASLLAHAGLIAAALIAFPHIAKDLQLGKAVPVTLVTDGPPAEMAPAIQAPEPAPAMTPQPVEEAPAEPAPVTPAPPAPPAAASAPKPPAATKPTTAKPQPSPKPAPAQTAANRASQTGLDLDALMASISSSTQRPSTRESSGQRGANRPRADVTPQTGHGSDDKMSASELDALRSKLEKLWNPNCQVEGAAGINIKVHMRLTPDGRLAAPPELPDRGDIQNSGDAILIASAQRATSAVGRGAPYTELNPEHYQGWRDLIVNFNAKQACARK